MDTYDRVTGALTAAGYAGRNGTWQCPAHDDNTPSLSVSRGADGRTLVRCHAGCTTETVVAALGLTMADLFRDNPPDEKPRIVATYDYTDENGRLLHQTVRFTPKAFRQRRPDRAGGWTWNLDGTRRVLYQLPQVVAAVKAGQTVWVVEGEKDADAATAAGVVATTPPMGAGKWRPEHTAAIGGADIVIVADRDQPGLAHAAHIAAELRRTGSKVTVLQPATGKDLSDHLAAGLTLDQLEPVDDHPPDTHNNNPRPHLRLVDLSKASQIDPQRVRWTWDQRIPVGTIALLAGPEGLGKSTIGYWLAAQVSRGTLPGEHYGAPKSVIVCATEDSWAHTIVPRLMAHGADRDRVYRVEVRAGDTVDIGLSLPVDLDGLADAATRVDATLLILDPLMSRLDANLDTHRDGEVRMALEPLADMADRTGMAILGVIHHNKSGSKDPLQLVMASKAFAAVARSVHTIIRDPDDDSGATRLFGTSKNNLGSLDLPTLAFTICPWTYPTDDGDGTTGQIAWGDERQETIAEALQRTVTDPEERSALDEAAEWLDDYLDSRDGHAEAGLALTAGRAAGHAERTLQRARRKLGLQAQKTGFGGAWEWSRPTEPVEGAQASRQPAKGPQDPELGALAPLATTSLKAPHTYIDAKGVSPPARAREAPSGSPTAQPPGPRPQLALVHTPKPPRIDSTCTVCHGEHHPTALHRCQCPNCADTPAP